MLGIYRPRCRCAYPWWPLLTLVLLAPLSGASSDLLALKAELESFQQVLPGREVREVLRRAQALDQSPYVSREFAQILSGLRGNLQFEGETYYPLKYTNPEIVELVNRTYISICKRHMRLFEEFPEEPARSNTADTTVGGGEGEFSEYWADFDVELAHMAESTLSEELYEYVWCYPQASPFRRLYVASVHPERTIDRLAAATGVKAASTTTYLYTDGIPCGVEVHTALTHLADIATHHPQLANGNREVLRGFIESNALRHGPGAVERYVPWRDYLSREAALRLLWVIGTVEDFPLLDRLTAELPDISAVSSSLIRDRQDLKAFAESVTARLPAISTQGHP